ncbi:CBM1 domain-containing protein [Mycena venus]|uniref:CBM1 domain-containing protein n=1 Tax=Mycena venus TaxID=2733690 RepID=A0A8H6YDD6_9AGAR|nr:CBM1 domain-containing protein [Mycena venus]
MPPTYPHLQKACQLYPAIDNHAHPILAGQHRDRFEFEGLISEAQGYSTSLPLSHLSSSFVKGSALSVDSIHTLACKRAVPQLGARLNLQSPTWDSVKATRSDLPYSELCELFMGPSVTGIQCMLLDDGLGGVEEFAEGYAWHDRFATSPTKRIVRVEIVAEDILKPLLKPHLDKVPLTSDEALRVLHSFNTAFKTALTDSVNDKNVAGFKSIACYRTGLDVEPVAESVESILSSLKDVLEMYRETSTIRLAHRALNDHVVRMTLEASGECGKPVQFHTGLGDNDITLNRSSPSHLQAIIKAFPKTLFVLLHSSYPFTREAGYLTAVYPNVYLDFGEVFPFVSGSGQRSIIRQVLELCPTNKILWFPSTDGHWWPESYYLGSIQARQALYDVLSETVALGEISEGDAANIVENALFHNANKLYKLSLEPDIAIFGQK